MFEFVKKFFRKNDIEKSFFELLGKEEGIESLVLHFYEIMENDPAATDCLLVHELKDREVPLEVKQKLMDFLSGWLGGPNTFVEKYGHPRMRARHMHVSINPELAGQWIYCMDKSIKVHKSGLSKKQKKVLLNSFKALALRIINAE